MAFRGRPPTSSDNCVAKGIYVEIYRNYPNDKAIELNVGRDANEHSNVPTERAVRRAQTRALHLISTEENLTMKCIPLLT